MRNSSGSCCAGVVKRYDKGLLSVANTAALIATREWVRRAPFCLSDVYLPDVYPPPHQGRRGKRWYFVAWYHVS
ncbi:hypothetical protein FOZ61_001391 [Perkinsus olseni]|uniref:Uncharacterized protein n=1 Tax=Perkinsus olseni TaxID=32597 RepID=A0A7J6LWU2_PEROL|nr:hypothetical protein FOZ61_001391 [Perkinsus olseni]